MALKRSDPTPAGEKADDVFKKMNQAKETTIDKKEKMKTISLQIKPSDYESLKSVFHQLGLSTGAGIRFALTEFLRNRNSR